MVLALVAQPAGAGFLPSPPGPTIDVESRPGVTLRYAAFAPRVEHALRSSCSSAAKASPLNAR
jgi:hypothetical protein